MDVKLSEIFLEEPRAMRPLYVLLATLAPLLGYAQKSYVGVGGA